MTTPEKMRKASDDESGKLPLRPIGRRSLADEVAERIREVVLAGALHAGERVSDSRLAQELGVGRSTVREAFRILLSEGLLESSGHGMRIAQLTVDDVQDTFELRLAVECRAARMVALRCDREEIAELRAIVEECVRAAEVDDGPAAVQLDLRFHETLCRLSGSRRLHDAFTRDVVKMLVLLQVDHDIYQPLSDWADELPRILAAIEGGDADAAGAAIEAHIEGSRHVLVDLARRQRPA
jgi:GntR family transcriptional regulator, gluconate operon transcriptional repressor